MPRNFIVVQDDDQTYVVSRPSVASFWGSNDDIECYICADTPLIGEHFLDGDRKEDEH